MKSQRALTYVLHGVCLAALAILYLRILPASAAAESGSAFYTQGLAAARVGHNAAAATDFEQALLHGHTDAATFYQLGLAYWKLKRLNDADWAIFTALGDPTISTIAPDAMKDLNALQNAGAVDAGPPALLRNVNITYATPPPVSPAVVAAGESQAAVSALTSGTYFVAPSFATSVNASTVGALSLAAADLENNSTTVAKFVFLSATPAPYTNLIAYAKDLFAHLGLQRAVLVVVTPQQTAAYTDRLNTGTTQSIAGQQVRAARGGSPADLAAALARAVVRKADANDNAQNTRSVILGLVVVGLILAVIGVAVVWVAGGRSLTRRTGGQPGSGIPARTRAR